jgi:hypothetical protein
MKPIWATDGAAAQPGAAPYLTAFCAIMWVLSAGFGSGMIVRRHKHPFFFAIAPGQLDSVMLVRRRIAVGGWTGVIPSTTRSSGDDLSGSSLVF